VRDESGYTPLLDAARSGKIAAVRLLLRSGGVDVNASTPGLRSTALMRAAAEGHLSVVVELLKCKGIQTNLKDSNGNTALALARQHQHTDIVDALLAAGAV